MAAAAVAITNRRRRHKILRSTGDGRTKVEVASRHCAARPPWRGVAGGREQASKKAEEAAERRGGGKKVERRQKICDCAVH